MDNPAGFFDRSLELLALIEHVALAVLIEGSIVLAIRNWKAGAMAACAWSVSRELTQAEYRWIETFGAGLRANMPWWGGLDPRVWQKIDPWLDWLIPTLVVLMLAAVFEGRIRAKTIPK